VNTKQLPQQLESVQVMVRFGFRLAIMIGFAVFAGAGIGRGPILQILCRSYEVGHPPRSISYPTQQTLIA
jgi:hypothetical protein